MHIEQLETWMHTHRFGDTDSRAERRTRWVVVITAVTMVVEIVVGWLSGSMALLADGWHMGTHMFALGIAAFAYRFARRHRDDPTFSFGTGKVASLAGFTSAIVLGIVALGMVGESISRLIHPTEIQFAQAMIVAAIGLVVNVVSAGLLHDAKGPGAADDDHHDGHDHHHDHNLRAAFIHVIADALTSVLAMLALVAVHFWGLRWMDPAVAIVGAGLITVWAVGLLRETASTLLDAAVPTATVEAIRQRLESEADNRVTDLHVWRVGGGALSVAVSIVTHYPRPPDHYKALLDDMPSIEHTTMEVIECEGEPCIPVDDVTANETVSTGQAVSGDSTGSQPASSGAAK